MKKLIVISMVAAFTASTSLVIAAEQTHPTAVTTPSVSAPVDVVKTATQAKEEVKAKAKGEEAKATTKATEKAKGKSEAAKGKSEAAKAKASAKKEALKENATKEATKVDEGVKAVVPPVPQSEEAKGKAIGKKEALKENAIKEATKVDAGVKAVVPPVPQNK